MLTVDTRCKKSSHTRRARRSSRAGTIGAPRPRRHGAPRMCDTLLSCDTQGALVLGNRRVRAAAPRAGRRRQPVAPRLQPRDRRARSSRFASSSACRGASASDGLSLDAAEQSRVHGLDVRTDAGFEERGRAFEERRAIARSVFEVEVVVLLELSRGANSIEGVPQVVADVRVRSPPASSAHLAAPLSSRRPTAAHGHHHHR